LMLTNDNDRSRVYPLNILKRINDNTNWERRSYGLWTSAMLKCNNNL